MDNANIERLLENTPVAVVCCVATGAAVGVLTDVIYHAVKKRRTHDDRLDSAVDKLVGLHKQLCEDEHVGYEDAPNKHEKHLREIASEYDTLKNNIGKTVGLGFSKPDISELIDYTKFSHKDEEVVSENGKAVTDEDPQEVNAPTVFEIISVDEFLKGTGNGDGYTSVVGTWFPQDGVLAGWNEQMEEKDPRSTIGEEAIAMFDDPEVDLVYVRNTHLKVLFEIMKSNYSFDEVVDELKEAEGKE